MNAQVTPLRDKPLTAEGVEAKIRDVDRQIAAKNAELRAARAALDASILESPTRDLGTMREHRTADALEAELRNLASARVRLNAALRDARSRDAETAWRAKLADAKAAGSALEAAAAESQALLAKLVESLMATRRAAFAFADKAESVGGFNEIDRRSFPASILTIAGLAMYSASEGALRPPGLLVETPHQIREGGRGDLPKAAREYATVALRGARISTDNDDGPAAA